MTSTEIMAAMDAIVSSAKTDDRVLSQDEVEKYEALESDLLAANKTAELFSRQAAYKAPVVGFPTVIKATPKGDEGLEFAFAQYLRTGQANADIAQLYAQNEGTNAAGGYIVPQGFLAKLTERQVAYGGLRNEATILDTGNGIPVEWPTVDDTSATRADIAAEGAASAAGADVTFGTKTLGAYKYAATGTGNIPLKVSVELLQDAQFDIASFVARILGTRIARKQAVDLQQGSGSGAPLGLTQGTTGDMALAAGDAITYVKLNTLLHMVDPAYRANGKWIFNDTTALDIEGLVDGNSRPLLVPSTQGLTGAVSASSSLLGFPVVIDQGVRNKANAVVFAAFGDFKEGYVVRNVKDVQVLVNPYAATGYVVYDAWARMDGTVQNANAFKTINGTT